MSRARGKRVIGLVALGATAIASQALAQTGASWMTAADGNWIDPTAWSTNPNFPNNGQPGATDSYDAVIDPTGSGYTVTLQNDISLNSLTLNAGSATLDQMGGSLALTNGGSIGSGTYQIDSATLNLTGTLNNAGIVNLGMGSIILNNGTFNNLSNGVVNIAPVNIAQFTPYSSASGSSQFSNAGTLNINAASNSSVLLSGLLANSGTISANSGSLLFGDGSYIHNTGATLTGPSFVELGFGAAHHVVNGTLTLGGTNINMSGGMISGGNVNVSGVLNWNGGTINASSAVNVVSGGMMNIGVATLTSRELLCNLTNTGTLNFLSGATLTSNGEIINQSGGVINFAGGNGIFFPINNPVNPNAILLNHGLINVNAGSSTTGFSPFGEGTFNVSSGTYDVIGGNFSSGAVLTGPGTIEFLGFQGVPENFNGTLTVSGSNVHFGGGTITGIGNLNLTGTMSWEGGTLGMVGALNVAPAALFNIGSINSHNLASVLNNSGTVNINGATITLNNGTFNNLSNGTVNIASTFSGQFTPYQFGSGSSMFSNSGTININGSTLSTVVFANPMVDSGTISVSSGTLQFANSTFAYGPGAYISGNARIEFGSNSNTQTINGNLTMAGTNMSSTNATFTGPGNLDITGSLSWNGGTFAGSGTMAVDAGGTMSVASFSTHTLSRMLSNSGTVNFASGSITLNNGTFNNTVGGVVNMFGPIPYSAFNGSSLFSNSGRININGASNSSVSLAGPFVDYGTIAANSGSLIFSGGSYTWNGTATVTGPGTVEFGSFSASTHVVNGDLTLAGSNMSFSGGTFSGPGNIEITGNLNWGSGTFGGTGTMAIASTGVVNGGSNSFRTLSRMLTNFGVYNSGNGSIQLFGGTFINAAGGTANFSSTFSGTQNIFTTSGSTLFNNSGQMNVSGGSSTLMSLSGPMVDYGTISANTNGSLQFNFGTFTWNNGAVINGSSPIELGASSNSHIVNGNLTMAGTKISMGNGSFSGPGNENVTGVFNWNGGTFMGTGAMNVIPGAAINFGQVGNSRVLSQVLNNSGTAMFSSATLTLAGGTFNNGPSGTVNIVSPGVQTLFATGTVGPNLIKNAGTVSVALGAATMQAPFLNTGSVTVIANGVLNTTAGLTNTGTIDLSGILTVGYLGASPLPTIKQQIISGLNGGVWKGIGIDSSSAASVAADVNNPHKTGIGFAEAAALGIVGTGSFAGQSVTDKTVIARYTYVGDANLDQTVNLLDLNAVATNFGASGKVWTDGDTNYDGVVNVADFNNVAMNFGNTLPLPPGAPALGALVPEPGAMGVAGVVVVLSRWRKRRKGDSGHFVR